jgi:intein/homing endonuclease
MGDWMGTNLDLEDFEKLLKADDLEEEPMPIQRFVTDRHYLGLEFPLSDIQLEIARHTTQVLKPETLFRLEGSDFLGGMSSQEYYKKYTVNEVICQVGKGAGKDHTSRISMAYLAYLMHCLRDPLKYYGKASGVYVDLVNLAVNAKQAQQVFFDPLKNILLRSPWANEVGFEPRVQEIFWFDRPVRMFSGHSEAEGWEGYEVLIVVLDEISAFKIDAELKGDLRNKGSASVIYEMARASITSRFPDVGKVVLLSFPRFKNDFIQQRYKSVINDLKEQGCEILDEKFGNKGVERERKTWALKAATWDVNPTRRKEEFEDEYRRDPVMAAARYESLVAGTRIWTSRGLLPIEEIVEGDYIQTRFGPKAVLKSWKQTEAKSCLEVEFKNGSKIQCSENHPFLKITSVYPAVNRARYGDYASRWEIASDLSIGDKVHCHYDNSVYGLNSFIDDAYILGLALSDGNIRRDGKGGRNYLSIACGRDRSFAEEISSRIDGYVIAQKDAGTYAARVDKRSVVDHFTELGLQRKPSNEKDVPASIFLADQKTIWSFISGVIDGDGCVRPDDGRISIVSTSRKMLENIQLIMNGMGCRSSITVNREPDPGAVIQSNYTLFSLNFTKYSSKLIADNINLFSYKKENLVKVHITAEGRNKNTGFTYVKNIRPIGFHEVYDVWVDDVEEFVCNGIVVHNCNPPEMEDAYFRDVDAVKSAFMFKSDPIDEDGHYKEWFRGNDEHLRYIHIDLGLKRDRAALGMVHCPGLMEIKTSGGTERLPIIEEDYLRSWEAEPYCEIPFSEIRNTIVELSRRFPVASVTFDQWQSADMIQSLRSLGINADLHTVKKTDYDTLSTAIYDRRFRGYWNQLLVEEELLKLKLINNMKVDHPTSGSKDLADAIAGATFMCIKELSMDLEIEIEVLQAVDYDELTTESIDMVQRYNGSAKYATDVNKEMPQDISAWLASLEII